MKNTQGCPERVIYNSNEINDDTTLFEFTCSIKQTRDNLCILNGLFPVAIDVFTKGSYGNAKWSVGNHDWAQAAEKKEIFISRHSLNAFPGTPSMHGVRTAGL